MDITNYEWLKKPEYDTAVSNGVRFRFGHPVGKALANGKPLDGFPYN